MTSNTFTLFVSNESGSIFCEVYILLFASGLRFVTLFVRILIFSGTILEYSNAQCDGILEINIHRY